MSNLTPDPVTSLLDPSPHNPPAGDWHDDDGRAIDDYLRTSDPGAPDSYNAVPSPSEELPKPQRILRARYIVTCPNQGGSPAAIRALPADVKRARLKITELTNNGFYFHSESFSVVDTPLAGVGQTSAYFVAPNEVPGIATGPVLDIEYTGVVYIGPPFDVAAGPVIIEILAVTC